MIIIPLLQQDLWLALKLQNNNHGDTRPCVSTTTQINRPFGLTKPTNRPCISIKTINRYMKRPTQPNHGTSTKWSRGFIKPTTNH
jgi:hypothetical protein